jgi:hypothetical protein
LDSSQALNSKGIGLGLYITKKIVQEFGGEVSVISNLGVGSEFSFFFKLEKHHEFSSIKPERNFNKLKERHIVPLYITILQKDTEIYEEQ